MGVEISFSQSYYWMDSWILANIIQLATQEFCNRYIDYRIDPGRRLYDQMVMAARCGVADIWGIGNPDRETIWQIRLDSPNYSNSYISDAGKHILAQKRKFDPWLNHQDATVVANALLILCLRENRMLQSQLERRHENFKVHGGFSENMTADRLEVRRTQAKAEGAPICPKCGRPMLKRTQRKGEQQGREFWGCSDYPRCNGIRHI